MVQFSPKELRGFAPGSHLGHQSPPSRLPDLIFHYCGAYRTYCSCFLCFCVIIAYVFHIVVQIYVLEFLPPMPDPKTEISLDILPQISNPKPKRGRRCVAARRLRYKAQLHFAK